MNEKNYKDLVICFTSHVRKKSIKMLSLHYHKLVGKTEEQYLMVYDYMLDKVLDKIKEKTDIDDTKILIDTDNKFP